MIVARLLVLAGIVLCIAQFYVGYVAVSCIVAGSVLSLISYQMKSKKLTRW